MNFNLKLFLFILILTLGTLITSCNDIFEPSIEKKSVVLLSPGDKIISTNYTQTFLWEPVEYALKYRLRVVTPAFDSVANYIVDTLISDNKFTMTLPPGNYQWRVRAENGSSKTAYAVYSISIAPSSIKQQSIRLLSPRNGWTTNQKDIALKWEALYGANQYHLQVDSNNFADESKIMFETSIPFLEHLFSFDKEKAYQWRVRAENDTTKSKWSLVHMLVFDKTAPAAPTLLSPTDNQIAHSPVSLQWSPMADAEKYKLYIYKADSTTLYNSSFPLVLQSASYSFSLGAPEEKIYWKVTAIDKAGNESTPSKLIKFTISK